MRANVSVPTKRIVHDLERQRGERRIVRGRALVRRLAIQLHALDRGHVERARQIVDHRVEQRLDALVLERRTADDRHERHRQRTLADQLLEVGDARARCPRDRPPSGRRPARRPSRSARCDIWQLSQPDPRECPDISNFAPRLSSSQMIARFSTRSTRPLKPPSMPIGRIQHRRTRTEPLDDRIDAVVEVGAGAIELVDEAHARHAIFVGLTPHRLGLRLKRPQRRRSRRPRRRARAATARPRS